MDKIVNIQNKRNMNKMGRMFEYAEGIDNFKTVNTKAGEIAIMKQKE